MALCASLMCFHLKNFLQTKGATLSIEKLFDTSNILPINLYNAIRNHHILLSICIEKEYIYRKRVLKNNRGITDIVEY